ncbi:MAG: chemotaxis protein [Sphingomonadales bacterium]|nr:chemotaxis protein [Sphingomonadales bacterium]
MKTILQTVSGKLILATGIVISLIVLVTTTVSGWRTWHRVETQVTALAEDRAQRAASEVAREMTEATTAATDIAAMLSGYLKTGEASSEGVVAMLETVPGNYDTLFASWMSGLADGSTEALLKGSGIARNEDGIFTPYWTKDDKGGLNFSTFTIDPDASWYADPIASGRSLATEPYVTVEGYVVTSVAAPVLLDGKVVAVAGVDITLASLSEDLANMETVEGGRMTLVDSTAKWVAHPDEALLTKPYEDFGLEELKAALADGQPRLLEAPDGSFRRFVFPFTTSGMNVTWATVLDVPNDVFAAPIRAEVLVASLSGAVILLMALGTIHFSARTIVGKPVDRMLHSVNGLAQGEYDTPIPFTERGDEIGAIAQSVETLRMGMLDKRRMEGEQDQMRREAEREREACAAEQQRLQEEREARRRADQERERREAEEKAEAQAREQALRAAQAQAQARVVETLATGLRGLAAGNLDVTIRTQFEADYDQLRIDFNDTVAQLSNLITAIDETTRGIVGGVQGITGATGDMSRQTENSAAMLEETAAALNELTASVKSAADSARHANGLVRSATQEARNTTAVVSDAVRAMGTIQDSSAQISKITNVIDDIAFQTNLLALNAGVEAARAGEAGRGFAVVASEVRALAQRASDAARDINTLISDSGTQVEQGVSLVGRAGEALQSIVTSIETIATHVGEIAASADEQAVGISEISTAMNHLDRAQQNNAAGVEETAAACLTLRDQADVLDGLVGRFRGAAQIQSAAA